jgi:hypothetical protein
MPRNPDIFRIDSDDPAMLAFMDRVRDFLNTKRVVLRKVAESRSPIEGELLLTEEGTLLYYVDRRYRQIFPPDIPPEKDEVPLWMEEHVVTVEDQLKAARIPEADWKYYGGF